MKCAIAYNNYAGVPSTRSLYVECAPGKRHVAWNTVPTNVVVARGTLACITASVMAPCSPDIAWLQCEIGVTHGPIDQTIVQPPFLWRVTALCQYGALLVNLCVTVHVPVLGVTPTYDAALSLMRLCGAHAINEAHERQRGEDPDTEPEAEPEEAEPEFKAEPPENPAQSTAWSAYICTC